MERRPSKTELVIPGFIPQFDGLRGLAILSVLVTHSEFLRVFPHAQVLEYGRIGVDLFFVLSGFLITGILMDSCGKPHYFGNFYARRVLRIWPLYYAVLTLVLLTTRLLPNPANAQAARVWPYFYLYVQNLFPSSTVPYGLDPTWSLAIEEQFYMTWPLVVLLLRKRALSIFLVCLAALSLLLRLLGYALDAPLRFIHQFTLCRLDAIAMGSLAAVWLHSSNWTRVGWKRLAFAFLAIGLMGTVSSRIIFPQQSTRVSYTFIALGFTGLLGIALVPETEMSLLHRFLVCPWLRYIGKISYGLYLVHMPIFLLASNFARRHKSPTPSSVLNAVLGAAAQFSMVLVVASISWRYFESPILRLKKYFPSGSSMHWKTENNRVQASGF
jgi:peptidoglycan/LPS O-acetylase OafA/YrhL